MSDEIHEIEEYLEPVEPDQAVPWRLFFVVVVTVILAIFILQNIEDVQLEFLWMEFRMPEAFVILFSAVISAVLTYTVVKISQRRKRKRAAAPKQP